VLQRIMWADSNAQNCHLDRRTLSICISMIENGVNPEALAVSFSAVFWVGAGQ
jgi:hypothetical protein